MKFLLFLLAFFIPGCATGATLKPQTVEEFARTSVIITNMEQTSGGSGVVYRSYDKGSYILTNRHVCGLLASGGSVEKDGELYPVVAYKTSKVHDVCLAKVRTNLGINTVLASEPPALYSKAYISGHPALFPHVLARGDFSGKMNIDIVTDVRDCTEEEFKQNPLQCLFEGFPITETLEAQLVSATILPGSSGSAVFNSEGEIAGLAFASNSRQLSYALIVPYEYVNNFVVNESKTIKWEFPKALPKYEKQKVKKAKVKTFTLPFVDRDERVYNIDTWKRLLEYIQGSNCQCSKNP